MRQLITKINDRTANLSAVASFGKSIDDLATLALRTLINSARSLSMRLTGLEVTLHDMAIMRHLCPVAVTAGATRVHESYSCTFMSRQSWRWAKPGPGAIAIKR